MKSHRIWFEPWLEHFNSSETLERVLFPTCKMDMMGITHE